MVTTVLMPNPKQQFFNNAGLPLSGGKVYTYAAGTTDPKDTYTDAAGTIKQMNPIPLNARGEPANAIRWSGAYDIEVRDFFNNLIYTVPNFNTDPTGSQGILPFLQLGTGADNVGYTSIIGGPGLSTVLKRLRLEPIQIEEFTAVKADGATNDGPAIRAAIIACQAAGKLLCFGGKYAVDRITVQDAVYNFAMHSNNAQFTGIASTNQPGVFEIVNCVDFHMTGNWRIDGANNTNYDMGLCVRAQTGTAQACTRINIHNPTFRNLPIGIGVGRYNIDYQCSEINVFGANFLACPIAVYNGGANSGAQYIGCNLISEANASFPGAPEKWLWQEGGLVKVVGGSVFTNPTAGRGVLFNPCLSVTYNNAYGTLSVVGAHVEQNSQLLAIANSRGLAAPDSSFSSVTFTGNAGFCGATAATDFIIITDNTYAGLLDITDNNWYSAPVRSGYNISSTSILVNIVIDKKSMGKNFRNWMGGVFGGKMIHDMQPVMNAYGLAATYAAGSTTGLKYLTNITTNELARYGPSYNPATGIFTVPNGGFTRLDIRAAVLGSALPNADFYLKLNGTIVAFGTWSGAIGNLSTTLYSLSAGDQISVIFTPYAGSSTSDAGIYNCLQMSGATG